MAKRVFAALALVGLLVLGGCKIPQEPRFEGITAFNPHGARNGKEPGITLGLEMHNPNPYKIKLMAYDLDIFLNGKQVGEAIHKGKQVMAAKGNSSIEVELKTDLQTVLNGVLGALGGLLGKENAVQLKVTGTVVARAKMIQKRIPVSFEKSWKMGN